MFCFFFLILRYFETNNPIAIFFKDFYYSKLIKKISKVHINLCSIWWIYSKGLVLIAVTVSCQCDKNTDSVIQHKLIIVNNMILTTRFKTREKNMEFVHSYKARTTNKNMECTHSLAGVILNDFYLPFWYLRIPFIKLNINIWIIIIIIIETEIIEY